MWGQTTPIQSYLGEVRAVVIIFTNLFFTRPYIFRDKIVSETQDFATSIILTKFVEFKKQLLQ